MTTNDLKQIGDVVDEKINKALEPIHVKLDEHTQKLDALTGDVIKLQDDVKGIRDEIGLWHGRDKREIDEIKVHVGLPIIADAP